MFKNLFNKKKEVPVEIKQDWAVYFCLVDNHQASIRLNMALNEIAPIEDYKYRIWFSVKLLYPNENGFITREEYPKICHIEDDILDALMKKGVIIAGAVKTNGIFDLYFYSKSVEGYERVINCRMKAYEEYRYAIDFKEDVNWDDYFNFLYPSEYEYQTIQNQKVLMTLEEHGNDPEKEREVDHWIYFKTEDDMENCIRKVEKAGYKVLSKKILDDDKAFLYQLNISRLDNTICSNVNDYVWELIIIANENNGNYDGWGCPIAKV